MLTAWAREGISRKAQYKDVYRRTIEMPQRAHTFKVDCCLKVHNLSRNCPFERINSLQC